MNRRLMVLVSAYACSPSRGSEPGVGWGFVSALARHHDLWVIVEEEKFREDIEQALAANPELGKSMHFHFIPKKRNRWLRKIWPPSYYRYYRQWHQEVLRLAESLHREVHFDLAHQLTMVGFREPGYLWKLDIPFVWGPVGGMGLFPWRFLPSVGVYGALYYLGYNLYNLLQMRFLPRPRLAARAAGGGLIAATAENRASAMRYWGCPSSVMCEVGLPRESAEKVHVRALRDPLRIRLGQDCMFLERHSTSACRPSATCRRTWIGSCTFWAAVGKQPNGRGWPTDSVWRDVAFFTVGCRVRKLWRS